MMVRPNRDVHAVLWEGETDRSLDFAELRIEKLAIELSGTILAMNASKPLRVDYYVRCDSAWRTKSVQVKVNYLGVVKSLVLKHDGCGHWTLNGKGNLLLEGCADVDLEASPSTNLLPIRRLGLAVGATGEVRAAWIRIPSLSVEPATQTYHRVAEDAYEYRDRSGSFCAQMRVDQTGLAMSYGNLWCRVCT